MDTATHPAALVVGASGAIGGAVTDALASDERYSKVIAVSRSEPVLPRHNVTWLRTDHREESLARLAGELGTLDIDLQRVVITTGVLHGATFKPEKTLEQLDADAMHHVFHVNAVVPALWLKALTPLLKRASQCVLAVTSARVGSIGDNRLGGWYSYRGSKAALNMVLQSAAIEYRRRAPRAKLLAFHPGTTDSDLSRPFQRNVAQGKLFSPAFVARSLLSVMDTMEPDGKLAFVDYRGDPVPW